MHQSGVFDYEWQAPFASLCLAFLNRYPSPLAQHIIYQDTLSQHYDTETDTLHLWKLVRKSGKLPKWAPKLSIAETWVLEETKMNLVDGIMTSTTHNLDLRSYLELTDYLRLEALSPDRSLLQVSAEASSQYIPPLPSLAPFAQDRIASYSIKSYTKRVPRTRSSLQLIHALVAHPSSPYRNNVLYPDQFPPVPPLGNKVLAELSQFDFEEAWNHWETTGEGFLGHGMRDASEHRLPPAPMVVRRPDFLEPLNYAWWKSRWRPDAPLHFWPTRQERKGLWDQSKDWAKGWSDWLAFWRRRRRSGTDGGEAG